MPVGYYTGNRMNDGILLWDYRCDELKKNHSGKHILFIGDSFCSGVGLYKEDTWAYKVYKKISEHENTDGYYNIGISGSSITEAIDQFYKYCFHYGNPDVVFFILTEPNRDERHCSKDKDELSGFIERMYFYMEQYCRSNNIQFLSFSWIKILQDSFIYPSKNKAVDLEGQDMYGIYWTKQSNDAAQKLDLDILLNEYKSFYKYDFEEMVKKVFYYDKKTKDKNRSMWAMDNSHAGTSFHDFWADFIYSKYKKEINDNFRN